MNDFGRRAYQFYVDKGYQPHQAAALAGNAMAESRGSTSVLGDGGKALGIFQWHPDRQANLNRFATSQGLDPRAETTQLAFKDWELNNTERRAGDLLRASTDVTGANNAVLNSLRPQGFNRNDPTGSHNYSGRLGFANQLLGNDMPTTAGSPAADGADYAPMRMAPNTETNSPATAGLLGAQPNLAAAGMQMMRAAQPRQDPSLNNLWKMALANNDTEYRPQQIRRIGLLG